MSDTTRKLAKGFLGFGKKPKPAKPIRKARVKKFIRVVEEEQPARRVSKNSLDGMILDASGRVRMQKEYE